MEARPNQKRWEHFQFVPNELKDSSAGWLFDHGLARVLVIFLDFSLGETVSPERSTGECGGGRNPPG
jgi:hypothetical protein